MGSKDILSKLHGVLTEIHGDLIKNRPIRVKDAVFSKGNGINHYNRHLELGDIPKTMTLQQYLDKAKEVSLKVIDSKTVRAFRFQGNRTAKTDGKWYVSYEGGKGGMLITAFPLRGGYSRFDRLCDSRGGTMISRE